MSQKVKRIFKADQLEIRPNKMF